MAKQSGFLQKQREKMNQNMLIQREFTIQQCIDLSQIALNDEFGLGSEKLKKYEEKFRSLLADLVKSSYQDRDSGDEDMIYTRSLIDRRLSQIFRCEMKWNDRYPYVKEDKEWGKK